MNWIVIELIAAFAAGVLVGYIVFHVRFVRMVKRFNQWEWKDD